MFDCHGHVVPPEIPFLEQLATADSRWLRFVERRPRQMAEIERQGTVFRRVRSVTWDIEERREELEAQGFSGQMLSAMPELMSQWADTDSAVAFHRKFNEWLAAIVARERGFFRGLGLVPAQAPDRASELLAEIAAAGLDGVLLPSHPVSGALHAPPWDGFMHEAARLGLLVFVHAIAPPGRDSGMHPRAANGVVFPNAVGEAAAGLIAAGTMARHPSLKVMVSHGGGSLVTLLPRLSYLRAETPELSEFMPEEPSVYAHRMWFDALVYDTGLLQQLADTVGADRIVHGTDYPFMREPMAYLQGADLRGIDRQAIDVINPARLLAELDARHGN